MNGVAELRDCVEAFTPAAVARAAQVPESQLIEAARIYARARRGYVACGTGPNMAGPGTLVEYLSLCLETLCGRWLRAGEIVHNEPVLIPEREYRAQAQGPRPGIDITEPRPGCARFAAALGLPVAGLPGAIMAQGTDRVRALISFSGNPVAAWPDQAAVVEALSHLELLVQIDVRMSATAEIADYVLAVKMPLEAASTTELLDGLSQHGNGYGLAEPYAQYSPAIVAPPAGSDVIEEWEYIYEIARAMGLQLRVESAFFGKKMDAPFDIDMINRPSTDELIELLARDSRIPLSAVRDAPAGAIYPSDKRVLDKVDGLDRAPRYRQRHDARRSQGTEP